MNAQGRTFLLTDSAGKTDRQIRVQWGVHMNEPKSQDAACGPIGTEQCWHRHSQASATPAGVFQLYKICENLGPVLYLFCKHMQPKNIAILASHLHLSHVSMSAGFLPMTSNMAFSTFQVRGGAQGLVSSSDTAVLAADLTASCMGGSLLLTFCSTAYNTILPNSSLMLLHSVTTSNHACIRSAFADFNDLESTSCPPYSALRLQLENKSQTLMQKHPG